MYTCIAYLIEIRKFCSKTWLIKVLILRPKMLYNSRTSTFNFKKIQGVIPRTPLKGEGEEKGRKARGKGGEAPPQFTFLATPMDRRETRTRRKEKNR